MIDKLQRRSPKRFDEQLDIEEILNGLINKLERKTFQQFEKNKNDFGLFGKKSRKLKFEKVFTTNE